MRVSSVVVESDHLNFSITNKAGVPYSETIKTVVGRYAAFHQSWLLDQNSLNTDVIKAHPEIKSITLKPSAVLSTKAIATVTFRI